MCGEVARNTAAVGTASAGFGIGPGELTAGDTNSTPTTPCPDTGSYVDGSQGLNARSLHQPEWMSPVSTTVLSM
jgi:hypothetical protein